MSPFDHHHQHAHVLPWGRYVAHTHVHDTGMVHEHELGAFALVAEDDVGAAARDEVKKSPAANSHEHPLGSSGLRFRHAHPSSEAAHDHQAELLSDVQILPPVPSGWRVFFPAWAPALHPWWHLWPACHMHVSHATAHFDSSGVDDRWCGALTIATQGFKVCIALGAFFWGAAHPKDFMIVWIVAVVVMSVSLCAAWCRICPQDRISICLTLAYYVLYIQGWILSAVTLYQRLEIVYGIPVWMGLIPTLGPPLYVTTRTILFFPSPRRRKRFLLAALSNRSVPCCFNFYVVGPKETWRTHAFLVMLNSWAMWSTLASKVVIFSLRWPGEGLFIAHALHLLSTWWASLYAIRCRQIAIDCFRAVDRNAVKPPVAEGELGASTLGREENALYN